MRSLLSLLIVLSLAPGARAKDVQLFNGKDLSGWTWFTNDKQSKMDDVWSVRDGVLHCAGKPIGYIRTTQDYTSFVLRLQWRTLKPGNGGVLLRASGADKVWPRSIEAQLQTGDSGDIWNIDEFPMTVDPTRTEGRRTKKLLASNEKPMGQWNDYEITLDGGHLTLKVNDQVQNEATNCQVIAGKICLQAEGAEMEYRNITLTPLEEQKPQAKNTDAMQSLAVKLYNSFTPEQRRQAVLKLDSPAREEEKFPGGSRAGIMLKELSAPQRELVSLLMQRFTSEYGAAKCRAIDAQPGNGFEKHYFAFFGEPGAGKTYAWRIAEHHLTIVHMDVVNGEPYSFGPILLGADPPVLWDEEEDKMISLYAALSADERAKIEHAGKAPSAKPLADADGLPVSSLSETAQAKVKEVLDSRIRFFSPEIQARVQELLKKDGGLNSMRIAFWGTADKRAAQGGKWDFKLGSDVFLCDYENTRGHIHLSMKGKLSDSK
jgi:hypothetical protein